MHENLLQLARNWLPRIDPRSDDEVEREQGMSSDEAFRAARERFGDIEKLKRTCRFIALKERIMLQKINLVLMIVVLVLVAAVSMYTMFTQRYNTLAINAMSAQMASINAELEAARRAEAQSGTRPTEPLVLVEGAVPSPGWYRIDVGEGQGTTLREVVEQAGGVKEAQWVSLRTGDRGSPYTEASALAGPFGRKILEPGNEIWVADENPQERRRVLGSSADILPGRWVQSNEQGEPIDNGMTLEVIGRDDLTNLSGWPVGTLTVPAHKQTIRMRFHPVFSGRSTNLQLLDRLDEPGYQDHSRYALREDGTLEVNLAPAAPDKPEWQEPVRFRKVSEE